MPRLFAASPALAGELPTSNSRGVGLRVRGFRWLTVSTLGLLAVCGSSTVLLAQPGVGGPKAPATKSPATKSPAAKTPAAPAANASEGEDYSGPTLPSDFSPPRKPPAVMTIIKELISEEDEKTIEKELVKEKFANILRGGERSSAADKVLQKGAKFNVHRLTLRKYYLPDPTQPPAPKMIHEMRDKLAVDTNQAGALNKDVQASRQFRDFYMKEITARAAELLDGNFHVRLNAVILLSELTIQGGDSKKGTLDEPYIGAFDPLVKVIEDKDQPEAVKVQAVKGLARICTYAKPNADTKIKIGQAMAAELRRKDSHFWYQMRLAEALGSVDLVIDRDRKPYLAQVLMETLVDTSRHCVVRSEAARSLGRIPLDGDINVPLVASEVVRLSQQMADQQTQNPRGIYWKDCYFKCYLAFNPRDAAGKERLDGLNTKVEKGPLAKHKAYVQEAYKLVVPMTSFVLDPKNEGKAIPAVSIDNARDFLDKKPPTDYRVAPNLQPLMARDPAAAPSAAAANVKPAG